MIGSRLARLSNAFIRLSGAIAAASALLLAACGGAAIDAAHPSAPRTDAEAPGLELTSIEAAEKEIARARAQLDAVDSRRPDAPRARDGTAAQDRSSVVPAQPAPAPPAEDARPSRPLTQEASKAALGAEDRCASPCRAIASMRRAVTALCRMTGTDDPRCVAAKHTLVDSEERISACSC